MKAWSVIWLVGIVVCLIMVFALSGCGCHNARSMQCMSSDDLIRELSRPI